MFALLLLFASVGTLYGSPVDSTRALPNNTDISLIYTRDASTAASCDQRTTYGIVWSCVVTILACVWGAVHPNIPGPFDAGWTILKHRMTTTFCVLLAPEFMVMWALRQHFAAKRIKEKYNKAFVLQGPAMDQLDGQGNLCKWIVLVKRAIHEWFTKLPNQAAVRRKPWLVPLSDREPWTMMHGFFVQMGGFILYEGENPKEVLGFDSICYLIWRGQIAAPTVTESELKDRSKDNALSKCIIVLQTSWFVVQCLARLASGLPLSELEVVTLAFAGMNGIVYWVWWDKPQGVGATIPIHLQFTDMHRSDSTEAAADHDSENPAPSGLDLEEPLETGLKPLREKSGTDAQVNENTQLLGETMDDTGAQKRSTTETQAVPAEESFEKHVIEVTEWQPLAVAHGQGKIESSLRCNMLTTFLQNITEIALYPLEQLDNMTGDDKIPDGALNVPLFYAYDADSNDDFDFTTGFFIGGLFGAVHFFAWASVFPSTEEQIIWRISTLITTAGPIIWVFWNFISRLESRLEIEGNRWQIIVDIILIVMAIPLAVVVIAYIPARIALLAGGLISLRALPQDVLIQIKWTSFIPHF